MNKWNKIIAAKIILFKKQIVLQASDVEGVTASIISVVIFKYLSLRYKNIFSVKILK